LTFAGQRLRTDRTSNSVARGDIRRESETGNYNCHWIVVSSAGGSIYLG